MKHPQQGSIESKVYLAGNKTSYTSTIISVQGVSTTSITCIQESTVHRCATSSFSLNLPKGYYLSVISISCLTPHLIYSLCSTALMLNTSLEWTPKVSTVLPQPQGLPWIILQAPPKYLGLNWSNCMCDFHYNTDSLMNSLWELSWSCSNGLGAWRR